jgi:hypothetical protein
MQNEIVARLTNLADSGQDAFIEDYKELAKQMLYEMGVSMKYLNSEAASYILGKVVTDLIDTGNIATSTEKLFIASLRVNHPHSEDIANV